MRRIKIAPIGFPLRSKGVASVVLWPNCLASAAPCGKSVSAACRSGTWTVVRSTTARPVTQLRFIGRTSPNGHCRDGPCFATRHNPSPSTRMMPASVTSSNRAALSAIAPSTDCRSVGEFEIARRISFVAVCCCRASFKSWESHATFCLRRASGVVAPRRRAVGILRRRALVLLPRCVFIAWPDL
jgi:hypothetical protein